MARGARFFLALGLLALTGLAHRPAPLAAAEPPAPTPAELPVPGVWESEARFQALDGYAWYLCAVELPESWRGREISLLIEKVDNAYEAFVGGKRVGGAGSFPPQYASALALPSKPAVPPPEALKFAEPLTVAIRVYDHEGRGGFKGLPPLLVAGNEALVLQGKWQFRPGDSAAWAALPASDLPRFNQVIAAAKVAEVARPWSEENEVPGVAASLALLRTPADLQLECVLAEPDIAQPVHLSFDVRGRLWVVEYQQYPFPAGLKVVSRDNFWRVVYDKVPEPPPRGTPGRDRISLHEDADGDGTFERHATFVDGLNIATACCPVPQGVWVLNPPYLLFYADANGDDRPDGDPDVHLSGFGLEDTHSCVNSLTWAPDGWLYACQGSTVTGRVGRPGQPQPGVHSLGQLVWRYHPGQKQYEIFAEGGGNAFGLEIDSAGRIFSGHNGGDTRGFHYVQGGYSQKGFQKHGPLSNPFAFGYFPPMRHVPTPRFTHTFVIYEETSLPPAYRGHLFGLEPLQGQVVRSRLIAEGSTFRTEDIERVVSGGERWFRPVDIKAGPEGSLYLADWHDANVSHLNSAAGTLARDTGRVYRLRGQGPYSRPPGNLATASTTELLAELAGPDKWRRRQAQGLLAARRDDRPAAEVAQRLKHATGQTALELLWTLNAWGGFRDDLPLELLRHAEPQVRLWTVRLACDNGAVSDDFGQALAAAAHRETSVLVRSQMASSARRLPAAHALPVVRALLRHADDAADPHLPLLLWWALEKHCGSERQAVLDLFAESPLWQEPLVTQHLAGRLMRRFAQAGTRSDWLAAARLLELAPDTAARRLLLAGFEEGVAGRTLADLPAELVAALAASGVESLALRVRRGESEALDEARRQAKEQQGQLSARLEAVRLLGEAQAPAVADDLLELALGQGPLELRQAALHALGRYEKADLGERLVTGFATLPPDLQLPAAQVLAARATWARQLMGAVQAGRLHSGAIPPAAVRGLLLHEDRELAAAVQKIWGELPLASAAELNRETARVTQLLALGNGNPYRGKQLFTAKCGTCHQLYAEGGAIGPDLTSYHRQELPRLLAAVVNPSGEIREGFATFVLRTTEGRVVSGLLVDQDNQAVVLRTAQGQTLSVARSEIESLRATGQSLMPEGLLQGLDDTALRDLFAYLQGSQPLAN